MSHPIPLEEFKPILEQVIGFINAQNWGVSGSFSLRMTPGEPFFVKFQLLNPNYSDEYKGAIDLPCHIPGIKGEESSFPLKDMIEHSLKIIDEVIERNPDFKALKEFKPILEQIFAFSRRKDLINPYPKFTFSIESGDYYHASLKLPDIEILPSYKGDVTISPGFPVPQLECPDFWVFIDRAIEQYRQDYQADDLTPNSVGKTRGWARNRSAAGERIH